MKENYWLETARTRWRSQIFRVQHFLNLIYRVSPSLETGLREVRVLSRGGGGLKIEKETIGRCGSLTSGKTDENGVSLLIV